MVVGLNGVLFGAPLDQVYVEAPDPVKVTLPPKQMAVVLDEAVTFGKGATVILTVAKLLLVHPAKLVPTTVY